MVKYQKKKVLHIANKNALHGGIGTVLDYLHNGVNESEDFQSDTLLTSYDHKNKRPRLSTLKKDDSNKNVKHADLDSLVEDYDVVHVHGIPHYGILEKLYEAKSKNPGLKVVNTAHSSVKSEFEAQLENAKKSPHKKEEARSLQYLKDRNVLNDPSKFADTYWGSAIWRQEQIMTISDSVQHMNEAYKAQILDEYSAEESAQKHTVVPNGVHKIKETVAKPNKKRLLFVGRFGKEKGVDEFVDALPHIFEENPDAEVRFVGGDKSGKVVEIYKKKVAAKLRKHFKNKTGHNVNDYISRIEFTGWVTDKNKLAEHYQWSDYLMVPSKAESFCLAAAEALMHERIPIITKTKALDDLYISKGVAFGIDEDKRDGKGIAAVVNDVFKKDPKAIAKMAKEGRKFAIENYSVESMIDLQLDSYRELLGMTPKERHKKAK